jgi:transcriptional regulator with XRE-family HTH domain
MILPVPQNSKAILGKTIRGRRMELGLSQEELAERANLHRTYVGGVERGERNVSLENIVRIAHALQIVPGQLLERIE